MFNTQDAAAGLRNIISRLEGMDIQPREEGIDIPSEGVFLLRAEFDGLVDELEVLADNIEEIDGPEA